MSTPDSPTCETAHLVKYHFENATRTAEKKWSWSRWRSETKWFASWEVRPRGSVTDRIPSSCKDESGAEEKVTGQAAPRSAAAKMIVLTRGRWSAGVQQNSLCASYRRRRVCLIRGRRTRRRGGASNGHPSSAGQRCWSAPSLLPPKTFDQNRANSPPAGGKHAGPLLASAPCEHIE
uniref:Uncharacterized protein n=1 Tax=Plectus sambesii TaxID=2011161 RepID=A0A914WKC5_9BILA